MIEEIEEYLEDNFENIKFTVKYLEKRTYLIIIELFLEKGKVIQIKQNYIWNSGITKESNLSRIRIEVNKNIIKLFMKGE